MLRIGAGKQWSPACFVTKGSLELCLPFVCMSPRLLLQHTAQLSRCDRELIASKVANIYYLALYRKRLPTPALENLRKIHKTVSVASKKWELGSGMLKRPTSHYKSFCTL